MEPLTTRQKEKLDALMKMDVERHYEWKREAADAQALRDEQRQWRKTEMKLRIATLALVAAELLVVAGIAWAVST